MKNIYITFLAVIFILTPNIARADFIAPQIEPTFENQSKLAVSILVNGVPLLDNATTTLVAGIEQEISYSYNRGEHYFGLGGESLPESEKERVFDEQVARFITYLDLWEGIPFTTEAKLIKSWDITGTKSGSVKATIPGSGNYFFVVQVPNALYQDPVNEICGGVAEACDPNSSFNAGTMERERDYFKTVPKLYTLPWNEVLEFVFYMGGTRFAAATPVTKAGNSNILFLPGITGSRLYQTVNGKENKAWEASLSATQSDIKALFLDTKGNSVNDLYTKRGDAVATVDIPLNHFDVYKTFFEELAGFKAQEKINDYLIFPYDWRASPEAVAESSIQYSDGPHYLEQELVALASTSATGKVTIIGHSNGGLVAKALMKKLQREGKENLVDKVLLVDVPQLGTPDSLSSMLHGDFGALTGSGGIYMSKKNARMLGENMPDAYALLPSAKYFSAVSDPALDFTNAPELRAMGGVSSTSISTVSEFEKYLTGTNGREKPAVGDVEKPNVLSSTLLASSTALHSALDSWLPPPGVEVIQIAGWGIDTAKGISYKEEKKAKCLLTFICGTKTVLTHKVNMTVDGDSTVVIPSESAMASSTTYYLNLAEAKDNSGRTKNHSNVTESEPFQKLLSQLLIENSTTTLPAYVSTSVPVSSSAEGRLRLRVLSPVTLDAYDGHGRHTGLVQTANEEVVYIEEQIPKSYYREYGEGKYLGLPADDTITIKMNGTDTGTFTYEITSVGSTTEETVTYKDIPVTASSTASMNIVENKITMAPLSIDFNGDGIVDTNVGSSTQNENPKSYIQIIKLSIPAMKISTTTEWQLLAKFGNIERLLNKSNTWDEVDNDNDKNDQKKNERIGARILRKLDKIEAWVGRDFALSDKKRMPKNFKPLTQKQTESLLGMILHLRLLIK